MSKINPLRTPALDNHPSLKGKQSRLPDELQSKIIGSRVKKRGLPKNKFLSKQAVHPALLGSMGGGLLGGGVGYFTGDKGEGRGRRALYGALGGGVLGGMGGGMKSMSDQLGTYKKNVEDLTGQLGTYKKNVEDLTGQLGTYKKNVEDLTGQLGDANSRSADFETFYGTEQGKSKDLEYLLRKQRGEHDKAMSDQLESHTLENANTEKVKGEISDYMSGVEAERDTLKERLKLYTEQSPAKPGQTILTNPQLSPEVRELGTRSEASADSLANGPEQPFHSFNHVRSKYGRKLDAMWSDGRY